jgi:hypothetical protein
MGQLSIAQIRQLVRSLSYVMSTHGAEELEDDNLSIFDFENIVLTGQIIERQRDASSKEVKYLIRGYTITVYAV